MPAFDVLMLGIGPEGHVASLFPGMPALYDERPVVAVRGSPKPPPTRLTMTLPSIQAAREVWVIASGPDKANAIAMALSDAGPVQVPAAGARGRRRRYSCLTATPRPKCRRRSAARAPTDLSPGRRANARPAARQAAGIAASTYR